MSKEALSVVDTLKLALEALKSSNKLINGTGTKFGLEGAMDGYYSGCFDVEGNNKLLNKAINAIKEALAGAGGGRQQSNEQVEPTCWITPDGEGFRMRMTPPVNDVPLGWTPLFDHPPVPTAQPKEPEQEPVAYFNPQVKGCFYWAKPTKITAPVTVRVEPMPLYTTPLQRKPMTDEQLDKAAMKLADCMDYPWDYISKEGQQRFKDHAKAIIEAAHGIKE